MCALRKLRIFMGAVLCSPGLVIADGGEPAAPNMPPPVQMAPGVMPPRVPQAPAWLQIVPVQGMQAHFLMPQPGAVWPAPLPYPAPMAMPFAAPATWAPFLWVLVPVQAMTSAPAELDYGPVADAPVVELPPPDEVPAAPEPEGAMPAPTVVETDRPGTEGGATTDTSAINVLPAAGATEPAVAPAAASVGAPMVDYGPVTPAPVVDLLDLQQQAAAESVPKSTLSKPARNTSAPSSPNPRSTATAKPVKKRMCWINGVVAPCR
jgi:hypothetical protein